ncbi:ABC transporter substrate-binding protein [Schleiferilactobacillus shenzhenensis]|uniref:Sugar ABC transporter substrate-binding protein n=1 Tax=Schleiferilactobacillus shenzhenensis LY-73 TaxID=1231336 RepID=U4TKJ4_9LACO|nr:lipoprotein [Schleiferilactobacillus shenzhenensis]ERL63880.1 hypothetical protein L248_1821 [Schleiferilactobacillus shenzhenensis LY-73]
MKRKLIAIIALLSMMLFALGACGQKGPHVTEGKNGQIVHFKFTYWGTPLEKQSIESAIHSFNKSHPNIRVTSQQISTNYIEKMSTLASTDDLPDVGYMPEVNMADWGRGGKLLDLSSLYKKGGAFATKLPASQFKFSGSSKIFGSSASVASFVLYYNKTYFAKEHVALPPHDPSKAWTWDEFIKVCQQLTVDRNGKHPNEKGFDANNIQTYGVGNFTSLAYECFLKSNGGGLVSQDGKTIQIGSPATIDALQKIQDLMYKYHVMPTPSQASTVPQTDTAMLTNRIAMSIDGSWSFQTLGNAIKQQHLKVGVGVLPKMGNKLVTMNYGVPIVAFRTATTTKYRKQALEFVKFLMDPQNQTPMLASGLWQPNQLDWYTNKKKLSSWAEKSGLPDHIESSFAQQNLHYLVQTPAFFFKDTNKLTDIINPALDEIWTGKKTAKQAVKDDIMPPVKMTFGTEYKYAQ